MQEDDALITQLTIARFLKCQTSHHYALCRGESFYDLATFLHSCLLSLHSIIPLSLKNTMRLLTYFFFIKTIMQVVMLKYAA